MAERRRFMSVSGRAGCVLILIALCCGCASGRAQSGSRPSETVKDFMQQERVNP